MDWMNDAISPPDAAAAEAAQARWNDIAKPLGSLGLLEGAITKIAGITGEADVHIDKRALAVFCADNGVVAHGVSQAGSDVTMIMAQGLLRGDTTVCHMARAANVDVFPIDVGMNVQIEGLRTEKTRRGTGDMVNEPAMSKGDVLAAIGAGANLARELAGQGCYQLFATGEMGIGNTTTSSAVASVLLGQGVEAMTGAGAGLPSDKVQAKIKLIQAAIDRYAPDAGDPIDVLAKVGGLDIAAMTGFFIGSAISRVPVLVDGLISSVAALAATRLRPEAAHALLASHVSAEPGGRILLEALGLCPLITANMRLGEGTGAIAAIPLLDLACTVYRDMSTFEQMAIDSYRPHA